MYVCCNMVTFGVSLTLAHVLLWETSSPGRTLGQVRRMMGLLSYTAACTFALDTLDNWVVTLLSCTFQRTNNIFLSQYFSISISINQI
jgi:hypothetical protein